MSNCIPLVFDAVLLSEEEQMAKEFCQEARLYFSDFAGKIYAIPSLRKGRDMDLVIWMHFDKFKPTINTGFINNPDLKEERVYTRRRNYDIWFDSALLVLELKKHATQDCLSLRDGKLHVKYGETWKNASDQNFDQVTEMRDFLTERLNIDASKTPRVQNFIWLNRCIEKPEFHDELDNIIYGKINFSELLEQLCRVKKPVSFDDGQNISYSVCKPEIIPLMDKYIEDLRKEKANGLGIITRTKLDLILKKAINIDNSTKIKEIGKKLLLITGNPGTGKTAHLIHLAYHLKKELYKPIILTYNRALVQDIDRMMYYSGYDGEVQIRTIYSFFFGLWKSFHSETDGDVSNMDFVSIFTDLYNLIKDSEPEAIRKQFQIPYDTILIDEAQDSENIVRDLVLKVFGSNNIVLSIGTRQILYPQKKEVTNWFADISRNQINKIELEKSYRNKKDLVDYFNSFSSLHFTLKPWDLNENRNLTGGKINILLDHSYTKALHLELQRELIKKENSMYDLMFLTPNITNNKDYSQEVFSMLDGWEIKAFNHLLEENKNKPFPINEHRILNYQSCRGLEAWVLVCWNLDVIIANIKTYYKNHVSEDALTLHVNNMLLMIFTRAIDTLVITFEDDKSEEAQMIINLAKSESFGHMAEIKKGV